MKAYVVLKNEYIPNVGWNESEFVDCFLTEESAVKCCKSLCMNARLQLPFDSDSDITILYYDEFIYHINVDADGQIGYSSLAYVDHTVAENPIDGRYTLYLFVRQIDIS